MTGERAVHHAGAGSGGYGAARFGADTRIQLSARLCLRLLLGAAPIQARELGVALQVIIQELLVALSRAHGASFKAPRSFDSA